MISIPTQGSRPPWWKDYLEIVYAPARVFARNENGNFWRPMAVVTIAFGVVLLVGIPAWQPYFESIWNERAQEILRRYPSTSPPELAKQKANDLRMAFVALPILLPLVMGLTGLVAWVIGKALRSSQTVRSAMVVAAFAYVPVVFAGMAAFTEGLLFGAPAPNDPSMVGWSLGRFFSAEAIGHRPLLSIVAHLDVFTIWMTVLLCIGLAVTGKLAPKRAILAGFIWLGVRFIRLIAAALPL